MYKVKITRRPEQHDCEVVAGDLSYMVLRSDMEKEGIILSRARDVKYRNSNGCLYTFREMEFFIEKGEPNDNLTNRLKSFGNAIYEPMTS